MMNDYEAGLLRYTLARVKHYCVNASGGNSLRHLYPIEIFDFSLIGAPSSRRDKVA